MPIRPKEPTLRYGTGKAIDALSKILKVEHNPSSQDWSYEISNPDHIEQYLNLYPTLQDEDERFVLMEIIIQAIEDQKEANFIFYWNKVKLLLEKDFALHEYTIFYWCVFDNEDLEDCFSVSGYMRGLWFEIKNN